MDDGSALVVGVSPVDFLIGHRRKRVETVVLDVAFFQHKELVVLHHIDECLLAVFPLYKQMGTVFRGPFLEPHVVVDARRDKVAPPVVSKFVAEQVPIGHQPFAHHELRVGNVGGNFQGSVCGQNVPHAFPRVRSPPVFQRIDGEAQLLELVGHGSDVFGLAGQPHGHFPICTGMDVVGIHVRRHRDGGLVRGDGVGQFEAALDGVAAEDLLSDEVALAMRCAPSCARYVVGVGRAFDEIVKARVPHLAKIGRNGRQADAQVVDVVAHKIEAAPVGILVGRTLVPDVDVVQLIRHPPSFRGFDVQLGLSLLKGHWGAIDVHAVHGQLDQIKPQIRGRGVGNGHANVGVRVEELVIVVSHVQRQLVRLDIE